MAPAVCAMDTTTREGTSDNRRPCRMATAQVTAGLKWDPQMWLQQYTWWGKGCVWGVGCGVRGVCVGCGVWGVGCGVWGVGCGVWGVGCGTDVMYMYMLSSLGLSNATKEHKGVRALATQAQPQ
jgi:hypothetical protein